jgi:hypothetical protein
MGLIQQSAFQPAAACPARADGAEKLWNRIIGARCAPKGVGCCCRMTTPAGFSIHAPNREHASPIEPLKGLEHRARHRG